MRDKIVLGGQAVTLRHCQTVHLSYRGMKE